MCVISWGIPRAGPPTQQWVILWLVAYPLEMFVLYWVSKPYYTTACVILVLCKSILYTSVHTYLYVPYLLQSLVEYTCEVDSR